MERAHVLVRLGGGAHDADGASDLSTTDAPGICRTSATTVRLEHSDMSPGVASITFEQVFDAAEHSNAHIFSESLAAGVDAVVQGQAATVVLSGAPGAGKSFMCHGSSQQVPGKQGACCYNTRQWGNGGTTDWLRELTVELAGIATLAIRHVFSQLKALHGTIDTQRSHAGTLALIRFYRLLLVGGTDYQVLLTCLYVSDDGELVDCVAVDDKQPATSSAAGIPAGNWRDGMESWLLEQSVRVGSSAEAVHLYSRAWQHSGERDFVLALHVEARTHDGRVSRGRFVCIDVHGK